MTVTVPRRDLKLVAIVLILVAVLLLVLNVQVQRISHTQDRVDSNVAATQKVLFDTVNAIQAGSPQAAYTRSQIDTICRTLVQEGCPPAAPEVTVDSGGQQ